MLANGNSRLGSRRQHELGAGAEADQPDPLTSFQSAALRDPSVDTASDGAGVSLQQLVDGLNALGLSPRDLIAILQAIKAAGAIQADIEVM